MVRVKDWLMTDEEKPPQKMAFLQSAKDHKVSGLTGIGLLVLEPMSDGGVIVHALGAAFTEAPTCREAVDAVLAWAGSINRETSATGTSLTPAEFDQAGAHLNAFIDEIGASFFWHRQMPPVVLVPGSGRWIYVSDSTAVRLSPQDRAGLMEREEFGRPSQSLLRQSGCFEDRPL